MATLRRKSPSGLPAWRPDTDGLALIAARQVTGQPMLTTHFVAEDQPEQTADILTEFFGQHVKTPEPR